MNILILSDFFYPFYASLVSYLNTKEIPSTFHIAYLKGNTPRFPVQDTPCLELPETLRYDSVLNQEALLNYVAVHRIHLILFPQISDVDRLIKQIKAYNPAIACLFLLHNRPDLVVAHKRMEFKEMKRKEINSVKKLAGWLLPSFYLFGLKLNWRRWACRQYRTFDKIVVLSPSYIQEYEEVMGEPDRSGKLIAIPNPLIEYESLVPIEKKKKQIIFVGQLTQVKAVHRLLHIWKKIYEEIPDWQFLIVGDGPTRKKNEMLAGHLGLKNITFLGFQQAIAYIDESAVLCLVSNVEGLPTVFTEAMVLGVVPIGFNSFSAIYEMIDDGENGVIIPDFDKDLYATALLRLAKEEPFRERLARQAREKVQQYRLEKVGKKWVELFEKLDLLPATFDGHRRKVK